MPRRAPLTKTKGRASLFAGEAADYRWQSCSSERSAKARSNAVPAGVFAVHCIVAVLDPSVSRRVIW